jgi:hypothetical protein
LVDQFIEKQDEPLDAELLLVDGLTADHITCRIPCKMFDSESPSAFRTEVRFKIRPALRLAERLELSPEHP